MLLKRVLAFCVAGLSTAIVYGVCYKMQNISNISKSIWVIIGSGNVLLPIQPQIIAWTNDDVTIIS